MDFSVSAFLLFYRFRQKAKLKASGIRNGVLRAFVYNYLHKAFIPYKSTLIIDNNSVTN